jgi:hypothetical protein
MGIKRSGFGLALFLIGAGLAHADWRADTAQLFRKGNQFPSVARLLARTYPGLDALQDRADASAILAYCAFKGSDAAAETRWIVEYFEACRMGDTGFAFLDLASQSDVIGWLNGWRSRYPYVVDISLVRGIGDQPVIPEGILPIVIEMGGEAFYKFSRDGTVLEGGEFKPGFNVIPLDSNDLVLNPGTRVYLLEIRSGRLELKKEITLDIRVTAPPRALQTAAPPVPATATGGSGPIAYSLSMYIGGELVMESRKTERPPNLALGIKPSNIPYGYRPDWVLKRDQPNPMNSFSIFQALGMIYSLLKDLFKKRGKKDVEPPKIETVHDLSMTYRQKDVYGRIQETKIVLKIQTKNLPVAVNGP